MENFEELIIYEDNHLLVLTKPIGVLSQSDQSGDADITSIAKQFIKKRDNKPYNVYLALVHRLDRNTGGVICLAKTSKAAKRLSEQIRKHSWEKHYLSMTERENLKDNLLGNITKDWTRLEDFLSKDHERNITKVDNRQKSKKSKRAELFTRVLALSSLNGKDIILRENKLLTGRSHQIRVQLASRGEKILGDYKYGASHSFNLPQYFLGLWAYKLVLDHPIKHEKMTFFSFPDLQSPWKIFSEYFAKENDFK